jgi:acyl-coenzyme A thioesterase PaaI-like protein
MTTGSRLAAAAALRELNNALVAHDADAELLDRITLTAREISAQLLRTDRRDRAGLLSEHVERLFTAGREDLTDETAFNPMNDRAVGGLANPISVEFDFENAESEVLVRTVLGAAYEGAPGRAHGGMVAAVFDDVTGFVLPMAGTAGYTGELTVRYLRPVPIGTPLEFRARIEGREGRKLTVSADCRAGDEILATADALFITVDVSEFGRATG